MPKQSSGEGSTPRERILSAASLLFGQSGVRATGVDALIAAAGVAKATFYRHFPSKDDLIVAWLKDPRTRWFDRVRVQAEQRAAAPKDLIRELFSVVVEWLEADDYRGCPYLNSSIELMGPAHRATASIRDYLDEIERYLQDSVAAAGYANAKPSGTTLQTLLAGSITLSVAHHDSSFALAARDAAVKLLATSESGRA